MGQNKVEECKRCMESVGLKEDVLDRTKWKNVIHNHSGDPRRWGKPGEKKMKKSTYCHDIYTIILLTSVAVRKLQIAILARLSREMSQSVRID